MVFVKGALPGEVVGVRTDRVTKQFAEATVVDVVDPSEWRTTPPCPEVANGCGGCDWQHAVPGYQSELRRAVVADAMRRIGKFPSEGPGAVAILAGPELPTEGYRTVLRAAVDDARAGFRRDRSHAVVAGERCLVAHPLAEELLIDGRYPGADEVRILVGARTGDRMVVVRSAEPDADVSGVSVPDDVVVVTAAELRRGRLAFIHEEILGRRLRVSAGSFFQCRPDGAEVLVSLVGAALRDHHGERPVETLLDAYAGVGLFSATLAEGLAARARPSRIIAVESNPSSAADARHNLAAGGYRAQVVEDQVERWPCEPIDAVVADPSRRGLQRAGVDALAATGAATLVLVSCDPAALARDARLLVERGYRCDRVTVVDLFGHTSHVEAVSVFVRER